MGTQLCQSLFLFISSIVSLSHISKWFCVCIVGALFLAVVGSYYFAKKEKKNKRRGLQ